RVVMVWDVAAGKLLFTLGEASYWLYTVAWSREHNLLAAAGVDRSIRVWQVTATGGKLLHSVFAHEGPVTRLVYGGPFDQLYSAGEDRVVKVWDPQRMVERHVFDRQQEAVLALAVRPGYFCAKNKYFNPPPQLALGRYDGALLLVSELSGKVVHQPLPVKPKPPQAEKLSPAAGQRGRAVRVVFTGKDLDGVTAVTAAHP